MLKFGAMAVPHDRRITRSKNRHRLVHINSKVDTVVRAAGASAALVLPCWWQSRIQAGDLGSHIYNAWLAQLIASGRGPGLAVVPQTTNVLFDYLLKALLGAFGADAAQRIAVSLGVLVLVWGAFAFVRRVSSTVPW